MAKANVEAVKKIMSSPQAAKCGATKKDGGACTLPAGFGTHHKGAGRCKFHGGLHPAQTASAIARQAAIMGAPMNITPYDAILWCVQISAGEVAYATAQIANLEDALEEEEVTTHERPLKMGGQFGEDPTVTVKERTVTHTKKLSVWISARHDSMDRLVKYSKIALDVGVAERQVRLAENLGNSLAAMLGAVLERLQLTPEQKAEAPSIVREELSRVAGGSASSYLPAIPAAVVEGSLAGGVQDVSDILDKAIAEQEDA